MYDILTYIWLTFMVNVGKYTSLMDANPKTVKFRQKKQPRFWCFLLFGSRGQQQEIWGTVSAWVSHCGCSLLVVG